MRNIFIDSKDTCCREIDIFSPCSTEELNIITSFLYCDENSFDTAINVTKTMNILTKIFGFPDHLFYVNDESILNKPKLSKIKEEFDPDLDNNSLEYNISNPSNLDNNMSIKSEVDPLEYVSIEESITPLKKQTLIQPNESKSKRDFIKSNKGQCDMCKRYIKGNLKRHIETVHEGKKPYQCSMCDKKVSRKVHLKKHIKLGTIHILRKQRGWVG